MHAKELLEVERRDIRALHYTWIAFSDLLCLVQYGATSHFYARGRKLLNF